MKTKLQVLVWLAIVSTALFVSCQNEEAESTVDESQTLNSEASLTGLLQRVATDFVEDNDAIDSTSCFTFKIPFTVYLFENSVTTPPGVPFTVNNNEDLGVLTNLIVNEGKRTFNQYPLTLVYEDASEVVVNGDGEYQIRQLQCGISNPGGDCLTLAYPITVFGYNSDFQFADTYLINSSSELFLFLLNLNPNEYYALDYPLSVVNAAGQTVSVNDNTSLEAIIQDAITDCQQGCSNPNILIDDLILYIPFANELTDLTGFSVPTVTGNYHYVTDRSGNPNGAFSFDDGTNNAENSVNVGATVTNDLMQTGDFTMSLWFRRQDNSGANPFEELMNSLAVNLFLGNQDNNSIMGPFLVLNDSTPVTYDTSWINDNLLADTENWHHVVITYQSENNLMLLYRDGLLRNTVSPVGEMATSVPSITFAIRYKGFMDDIRAYKRALNSTEIQTLYNLEGDVNTCLE